MNEQKESFFYAGPTGTANILEQLRSTREEIGYVAKAQTNTHHKYNFRGIDDAMNVVGPMFSRQKITPIPVFEDYVFDVMNAVKKNGDACSLTTARLRLDLYLYADDGSYVMFRVRGEGRDTADDKATAKAQSMAYKIAIFMGLMLPVAPDMLPDPDREPPGDDTVSGERASSQTAPEDEGRNRSEKFNKCSNIIGDAIKEKSIDNLKKYSAMVTNTASFTAEEKAILHRKIASGINQINHESQPSK